LRTMERLRVYAASAVFLALTAVKLLSPALADGVRENIVPAISRNDDYMQAVQTLGQKLNIEGLLKKNENIQADAETSAAVPAAAVPTAATLPSPTPVPTPVPAPTPSPIPEKVQTFLENQKKYQGHKLPADVITDMPQLPFEYAEPVKGTESSGFGYRMHPILNEVKFHYGTDFAAQSGDAVYAFADGTVETAGDSDTFGKYIVIDHADGYKTLYAHCSRLYVKAGRRVKKEQMIALVGETGQATGPHLHFELTCSGKYLNPEYYV
jgi:murein DD-endopeptidase MepM/ murein hydrolase activator NlpD